MNTATPLVQSRLTRDGRPNDSVPDSARHANWRYWIGLVAATAAFHVIMHAALRLFRVDLFAMMSMDANTKRHVLLDFAENALPMTFGIGFLLFWLAFRGPSKKARGRLYRILARGAAMSVVIPATCVVVLSIPLILLPMALGSSTGMRGWAMLAAIYVPAIVLMYLAQAIWLGLLALPAGMTAGLVFWLFNPHGPPEADKDGLLERRTFWRGIVRMPLAICAGVVPVVVGLAIVSGLSNFAVPIPPLIFGALGLYLIGFGTIGRLGRTRIWWPILLGAVLGLTLPAVAHLMYPFLLMGETHVLPVARFIIVEGALTASFLGAVPGAIAGAVIWIVYRHFPTSSARPSWPMQSGLNRGHRR